jgi:hypothetical protein
MTQNLPGNDLIWSLKYKTKRISFGLAIVVGHKWNGVQRLILTRLSHKRDLQSCPESFGIPGLCDHTRPCLQDRDLEIVFGDKRVEATG